MKISPGIKHRSLQLLEEGRDPYEIADVLGVCYKASNDGTTATIHMDVSWSTHPLFCMNKGAY